MGNQILAQAAKDGGAKAMFGYPITPSTEILETWAKFCLEDQSLSFLQTEDEMAAGFAVIGACLAGVPAFTATAGPGNILMQDAFVMAEALRIPTVALIMQRGGMSTSTVIYSQQEVRLTCFGGNSEGFRIVFSPSNLQELYDFTLKAFQYAWRYRWPTFVLADGYQAKMKGEVEIPDVKKSIIPNLKPILGRDVNLRNCYNMEEEINEKIVDYHDEYEKVRTEIEAAEEYRLEDAKIILLAHGIVSGAAKLAIDKLRAKNIAVGLFRPITLRPFPVKKALKALADADKIICFESAIGQLSELFKKELYELNIPLKEINKPSLGFTPEEIIEVVTKFK